MFPINNESDNINKNIEVDKLKVEQSKEQEWVDNEKKLKLK